MALLNYVNIEYWPIPLIFAAAVLQSICSHGWIGEIREL